MIKLNVPFLKFLVTDGIFQLDGSKMASQMSQFSTVQHKVNILFNTFISSLN